MVDTEFERQLIGFKGIDNESCLFAKELVHIYLDFPLLHTDAGAVLCLRGMFREKTGRKLDANSTRVDAFYTTLVGDVLIRKSESMNVQRLIDTY
jgi:hypothetical protein